MNTHALNIAAVRVTTTHRTRNFSSNCVPSITYGLHTIIVPDGWAVAHVSFSSTGVYFLTVCDARITHSSVTWAAIQQLS